MTDVASPPYVTRWSSDLSDAVSLLDPYEDHDWHPMAVRAIRQTEAVHGAEEAYRHAVRIADEFEEVTLRERLSPLG